MKREKQTIKERRKRKVRAKIRSNQQRPRLTVFRSNKHIYAQIIDDEKSITLVSVNETELKTVKNLKKKLSKLDKAYQLGELLAQKTIEKSIKKVAFDRGAYKYHGRVKALSDGARKGGLKF